MPGIFTASPPTDLHEAALKTFRKLLLHSCVALFPHLVPEPMIGHGSVFLDASTHLPFDPHRALRQLGGWAGVKDAFKSGRDIVAEGLSQERQDWALQPKVRSSCRRAVSLSACVTLERARWGSRHAPAPPHMPPSPRQIIDVAKLFPVGRPLDGEPTESDDVIVTKLGEIPPDLQAALANGHMAAEALSEPARRRKEMLKTYKIVSRPQFMLLAQELAYKVRRRRVQG